MAKIKLWYLHCYESEESAKQPIQPGDELELSLNADGGAVDNASEPNVVGQTLDSERKCGISNPSGDFTA